jgi:hypothetical protein
MTNGDTVGKTPPGAERGSATTRGVAHAITLVVSLFVGGFTLLFVLSRAQDEDTTLSHPLDFLMDLHAAIGTVWLFIAVSLLWILVFVAFVELIAACQGDKSRGPRKALLLEIAAFAAFLAVWYIPFR